MTFNNIKTIFVFSITFAILACSPKTTLKDSDVANIEPNNVEPKNTESQKVEVKKEVIKISPQAIKEKAIVKAIRANDITTLTTLIADDSNLRTSIPFDSAIIPIAVKTGDTNIVALLLKKGAYINQTIQVDDNNFQQITAIETTRDKVMKEFLKKNGCINGNVITSKAKYALRVGRTSDMKKILETAPASTPSLIVMAVIYRRAWQLNYLLEHGADINIKFEPDRKGLLHFASENIIKDIRSDADSIPTIFKILFEAGINKKQMSHIQNNRGGESVFDLAIAGGNDTIVNILLENGFKYTDTNARGNTPLLQVSNSPSSKEFIIKQLEIGIDVKTKGEHGNTLLHKVSSWNKLDLELIKSIIAKGGDVNANNDKGITPLSIIVTSHGGRDRGKLIEGVIPVLEYMISQGASLKDIPIEFNPILFLATDGFNYDSNSDIFKILFEQADASTKGTKYGKTALHHLVKKSSYQPAKKRKSIEYLINANANLNALDKKGKTPLDMISNPEKRKEFYDYLVSKGFKHSSELTSNMDISK